ncbi:uncharacterized protein LOC110724484 [Chenopodium quinoa]|uniref:uncharacterized protein LOC110724484 n=1 Tax=Chenopodium quinoa TaxID=63459 RepID=UPI000B78C51F|nr:uncharacterized protein LOC110724484 [Chenopodium quinoa]
MAEELANQCSKLRLHDQENEFVDVGEVEDDVSEERIALMLVGRLITDRNYNLDAFKRTMTQAWSLARRVVIRVIGAKLFVFQFFHWKDREKVLEGRPWCFENNLLALSEVAGNEQPSDVMPMHSPFWVRLENLPFNRRSDNIVKTITTSMGELLEIENDDLGLDKYRRVKLNLDISKPLRRFVNMRDNDGRVLRIDLKYERMPFFCLMCGVMGHSERDCLNLPEEEQNQGLGWNLRLRATPRKGRHKLMEEVEEVKACRKILFISKPEAKSENKEGEGAGLI